MKRQVTIAIGVAVMVLLFVVITALVVATTILDVPLWAALASFVVIALGLSAYLRRRGVV